jgi:serine/threonine-protein kinase
VNEPSLIGSDIGDRYRLLEMIGDGGMGRVFRAEQIATGQPVAVKVLHREFAGVDEVAKRFEREARVMTELAHPHVVKVIEFGEWNGRLFLAMELLGGRSLAELLKTPGGKGGRRLAVRRALAIMRPVLNALDYAHQQGVVHRDLKPENIMVVPGRGAFSREREKIKLLDFGIARLGEQSDKGGQKLTQQGLIMGTPDYMSPEQAVGQAADARSDLYSAGVILYEMLTGHKPFEAGSSLDVLVMHIKNDPRPPSEVAPGALIPLGVEQVVLRLLAKRPEDRFQTARELRQALDRAAANDSSAVGAMALQATMWAGSLRPPPRRLLLHVAIIGTALVTLLGNHRRVGPVGSVQQVASSERAPPDQAQHDVRKARTASKRPVGRKHLARPSND